MKRLLPLIFILLFSNNIIADNDSIAVKSQSEKTTIAKSNLVDFSGIVPNLLPTVVNVSTTKKIVSKSSGDVEELLKSLPEDSIFGDLRDLLEKREYQTKESYSSGSGFVISDDGYIVTNQHVVDGADEITVSFQSGEKIKARLVGVDKKTDIALLKINIKRKLKFAEFGNSDKIKIGQWIVAVGNPFGLGGSVSAGIISARGRDINAGKINDFIQTDAAINKGNSGGPLFNTDGKVVGIATAIYSPSGGNIGIGFATPSNIANDIVQELKKDGKIKRGYLGVSVQEVTKEIAESINIKDASGAMVIKVFEDSPADKGKILPGDIITKFNGKKITKMKELPSVVAKTKIGKKVKVEIIRGGDKKVLKVRIEELDSGEKKKKDLKSKSNIFGMGLKKIDDDVRKKYKISESISGLLVTDIKNNSIAGSKGVKPGDILLSANQIRLKSIKTLEKIIIKSKKRKGGGIFMIIKRGDDNFAIILPLK